MKPKITKDAGHSVRARLLTLSKASGDDFQRVLTRYAIERLLFRLSQTEDANRYILKGAMLFITWPEHVSRPTGDLDLLGYGDAAPEAITELFTRVCQVELRDDGILFDPTTLKVEPVREAEKYQGVRLSIKATLASAVITVLIDIGFGDHVYPAPKRQNFPTLLPGLPEANVLMYPPETVIAEKFEAMIRFGETNGRVKDYHDIWITTRTFPFDLAVVIAAISGTLKRRETAFPTEIPIGLTNTFAGIVERKGLWSGFLRRTPPVMIPPPFPELLQELRRFFGPVIANVNLPEGAQGHWDPSGGTWS